MSGLPLYLSAPSPCAYLADEISRTIFVDPHLQLNTEQKTALTELGFRRSGPSFYRPNCPSCQACESTRIAVNEFHPNRTQRRCLKRNADLIASWEPAIFSPERFALYQSYLRARHADGDMDPDDEEGFQRFLCNPGVASSQHLLIRDAQGQLLAVAVADRLLSGLSAVYTFFDPNCSQRSLGRYAVLRLIEGSKAAGLPWLYLGYYIQNSAKMAYKAEYAPQQRFIHEDWTTVKD